MTTVDRLAVCEASGSLALYSGQLGAWVRRELLHSGASWPSWNPTQDLLAVSILELHDEGLVSSIELVDLEGGRLRTMHTVPRGLPPVIAPRLAHYCIWSPAGDILSYVAQGPGGLTLFLGDRDGPLLSDSVLTGAPLFSAWSRQGGLLALHAGPDLSLVDTVASRTPSPLTSNAVGFRVPAFSDDGELLVYACAVGPGVAIMCAGGRGEEPREVQRFAGGVALAFRPQTRELTVALTRNPETGMFDELWRLALGDEPGPAQKISGGPFVACSWAPGGEHMALVVPTQSGDGRYAVRLVDPGGALLAATEGSVFSPDYRIMLGFFDQFALSHRLWSPHGDAFLLAGRLPGDGVPGSMGDPHHYVMAWRPAMGKPPEVIGLGEIGFFQPSRRA